MNNNIDMKESIIEYLNKKEIEYSDRLLDMVAIELSSKIEDYEYEKNITLTSEDKPYHSLLSSAVYTSLRRLKGVHYNFAFESAEDDYSEESDAEMHL